MRAPVGARSPAGFAGQLVPVGQSNVLLTNISYNT